MKKILGLDLGTNSIGWALIEIEKDKNLSRIIGSGSRIIPMSKAVIKDFERGVTKSQTAEKTEKRGTRILYERSNLRRERLHRVLNVLGYLPKTYSKYIDFNNRIGKFLENCEPLLAYSDEVDDDGKRIFLFQESYKEMEKEFREVHKNLPRLNKKGKPFKLPYDWTLYYLRKKALKSEISNEELAWILLNFNQKRGYYQQRQENEILTNENKTVKYILLKAKDFIKTEDKVDDKVLYNIIFEDKDGVIYDDTKKKTTNPSLWKNKTNAFIITITKKKDNKVSNSYREVKSEDDWEAIKRKTQQDLKKQKFVGKYIYEAILKNLQQKIKGELIRTIDRDFYFYELKAILKKQKEFRKDEWNNEKLFKKAILELYPNNIEHQEQLLSKTDKFIYLFLKDILYYHRPLKSQKSLISKCTFEKRYYIDEKTKNRKTVYINGIPKSHPLFQEFRVWQLAHNIRIQKRQLKIDGKIKLNADITDSFIVSKEDFRIFFNFLYNKKDITQQQLISYFIKDAKDKKNYRWNYTDDDKIKLECNQTRINFKKNFDKKDLIKYTDTLEYGLWQIVYSVTDTKEYNEAINSFSKKNNLSEETREKLKKSPMLKKEYASYSEKAIKKLLTLMRSGSNWKQEDLNPEVLLRIDKLLTGEFDKNITNRVREKSIDLNDISHFQGLPLWLASYIIYDKHSEVDITQWKTSKELEDYINSFKQHSLRNPIVEQVILESLRVTLDIWKFYGNQMNIDYTLITNENTKKQEKVYARLFDKIHIEIGRDLKNPKKVREKISNSINKNKDTNQRIRELLYEFKNFKDVKDIRPNSKTQFDKLKIYEQTILSQYSEKELKNEVLIGKLTVDSFIKKEQPTSSEILKYKLWLEQKYKSPYTQKVIRLSDLFTSKYEIEHVIPQSKYLDNSFNNKIICETEVNSLKDNRIAYNFIQEFQETEVPLNGGGYVSIIKQLDYEQFVKENYDGKKLENLLREDIPKNMVERQKNDMRYISKVALKTFSNIVREDGEQESTVKNVLSVAGGVTAKLRFEWGLNSVWSSLVEYRFRRLNILICGAENEENGLFGKVQKNGGFFKPEVPLEFRDNFELKRIDHRHHALDAIIIASITRAHVNYINNNNAKSDIKRFDLGLKLRNTKNIEKVNILTNKKTKHIVLSDYKKPWDNFTADAKHNLEEIIISFKQNLRAINKATNYNLRYKDENGNFLFDKNGKKQKQRIEQTNGKKNWAIRKPLHEDTYFGLLENGKNKGLLVKREPLNSTFTEEKINDVIDEVSKKILLNHLKQDKFLNRKDEKGKDLKPHEVAFSALGIDDLNNNIIALNNGVFHYPIKKIRLKFNKGKQFSIKKWENENGQLIKESKFVKSASGTNLYFCIYEKDGQRKYYVPNFEEILATQKIEQDLPISEKKNVPQRHPEFNDFTLKFYLQPNDLVYIPIDIDEDVDFSNLTKEQLNRIYLFKDGSGTTANFIPMYSADVIFNLKEEKKRKTFATEYGLNLKNLIKNEYGLKSPQLKNQNSIGGIQVKSICWKLKSNRLGNIIKIIK
ncbi:type II CRISPR RNA-guided endonuclease Cas9 [Polaribacter sp.]|uniref:type II CRISPR RNA-guided endonuclease Cas9 n=1 Tax=Polaribacter sp. TaxID=1920175 RepID=UPI003EF24767